jgi:hypothetical protein
MASINVQQSHQLLLADVRCQMSVEGVNRGATPEPLH